MFFFICIFYKLLLTYLLILPGQGDQTTVSSCTSFQQEHLPDEPSLAVEHRCPTWFLSHTANSSYIYCECGSSLSGAIMCNNVTKEVSITLQYCMTYSNISGKQQLVVGFTNTVYLPSSSRVHAILPCNVSEINDFMCTNANREGLLCGECISGYGYAINSYNNECAKCDTAYAVGMFLLCTILPMTICFFLIVFLRLNIPSGFLLGYIIFCQCIVTSRKFSSVLYDDMSNNLGTFGKFNLRLSLTLAGMSHYFMGAFYLIEPTCIYHNISGIQVLLIEYIYCIYPLLLLSLTVLCVELRSRNCKLVTLVLKPFNKYLNRLFRNWSFSDGIIRAYATFYFLSYVHLVYLSYSLVNYTLNVYDINFTVIKTVLVCEPTIESFSKQHLVYAIPALIILLLLGVLPTLLLCQQSTRVLRKCFTFRSRIQLMLDTFVESFAGCYKDGFNNTFNFRCLSAIPMIVPLCMFVYFPSAKFQSRVYSYLIFSLTLMIYALIISFLKPFKSRYINRSMSFHVALLSFCVFLIVLWFTASSKIIYSKFLASLFIFITLLPHVIAFITIIYHCVHRISCIEKRMETLSEKFSFSFLSKPVSDNGTSTTLSALPDRLENSLEYKRL